MVSYVVGQNRMGAFKSDSKGLGPNWDLRHVQHYLAVSCDDLTVPSIHILKFLSMAC